MKITQETNEFKPITIVLETREEAEALMKACMEAPDGSPVDAIYYELTEFWNEGREERKGF